MLIVQHLHGMFASRKQSHSIRAKFLRQQLNSRSWAAADDRIALWRHDGAAFGAPLEVSARFGFTIFYELVKRPVEHRLPMKLDY